jgi:hypothetical protein
LAAVIESAKYKSIRAERGWSALLLRLPQALLLALALTFALGAGERLLALLAYSYPHDGLEGTLLHEAGLMRAGEPLYQPLELYRFVSAPYPPLHAVVLAQADRLAGPHLFWSGRLISLVSALLVALLVTLSVRHASRSWVAGLIGAALLLAAPPVILWGTRIKPDMLALFLTALGLYLALHAPADEAGGAWPRWPLLAAALCFGLAFFTKQTAIIAPLAVGLALLVGDILARKAGAREHFVGRTPLRRRTLAYGLAFLVPVLVVWALLDLATAGQYSYHVWEAHRGEGWKAQIASKFMTLLPPYLPLAALALALAPRALRDERARILFCYALFVPLTLLGTGVVGANHNHLLETILALTLAGGSTVGLAMAARPPRPALLAVALLVLTIQFRYAADQPSWYDAELEPDNAPARFIAFIQSTPGEVLADDISLLYAAGKPIRYDDPAAQGPLAVSGHWDQRGMLDDIAKRRFSAILIPVNVEKETSDHAYRWSPEMIAAIREHYQLIYRDKINTYVPKS